MIQIISPIIHLRSTKEKLEAESSRLNNQAHFIMELIEGNVLYNVIVLGCTLKLQ